MRGRPRKYSDKQRYIVSVLWLHGMSEQTIADGVSGYGIRPMSRAAVGGQLSQTPFRGRDKMPAAVRQRFLDQLKSHRLDGGILPENVFRVMP